VGTYTLNKNGVDRSRDEPSVPEPCTGGVVLDVNEKGTIILFRMHFRLIAHHRTGQNVDIIIIIASVLCTHTHEYRPPIVNARNILLQVLFVFRSTVFHASVLSMRGG